MIDYANLTTSQPTIDYDTTVLTNEGYELKFALDFENPDLQEVISRCDKYNWPYKVKDTVGRQKHLWIKGWIKE